MNIDLRCGDCFDLLPSIPDGSVDLLLTDPPYGITACEWDVKPDITRFFDEGFRTLKPTGTLIVFGVEPFSSQLRVGRREYKYDLYWVKRHGTNFVHCKNRPMRKVEIISVFSKGVMGHKSLCPETRMTYNPQGVVKVGEKILGKNHVNVLRPRKGDKDKKYIAFSNFPTDVLQFDEKQFGRFHPSEKPQDLMEWLIKTYSSEGETVLDPFMGSGSTGVAAKLNGRSFIGFEKDKTFFEVANNRISETVEPPLILAEG